MSNNSKRYINYNRFVSEIIILTGIVLFLLLLICSSLTKSKPVETATFQKTFSMGTEQFQMEILNPLDPMDRSDDRFVSWWENEGYYYFFLPSKWEEADVYWIFNLTDKIKIDGEEVLNGSKMYLSEGRHIVEQGEHFFEIEILFSSDIASLFIEMEEDALEYIHENKENITSGEYVLFDGDGNCANEGAIESIYCRGNASFYEVGDKKSYTINLEDETDFMGFGKSKKWLLISNYFDESLLRNQIVNELAHSMGMKYTPQMEYVDLYVNGEYVGNYLLSEKIEVDPERVAIYDLEKETERLNANQRYKYRNEITTGLSDIRELKWNAVETEPDEHIGGGYILEIDYRKRYDLEESGFITSRKRPVVIQSPQYASYNQAMYIASFYQEFEDALFTDDGINAETGKHYTEYIDMDSFIAHYYIDELSKQIDASTTSFYLYKPETDDKFYAGPVWDYDKSFGSEYTYDQSTEGLFAALDKTQADIWYELYNQKDFNHILRDKYVEKLYPNTVEIYSKWIPKLGDELCKSAGMNLIRCHSMQSKHDAENKYWDEVKKLSDFIEKRLFYLSKEWNFAYEEKEEKR